MGVNNKTDIFLYRLMEDAGDYVMHKTADSGILNDKKTTIRSLMNIRMPGGISDELLNAQDAYLAQELKVKGVVKLSDIPVIDGYEKISIWQGDITRLEVGAIVNAANSQMLGCFIPCHRCIDNAIHSAAGMQLREACSHIMQEKRMRYGRQYEEPVGGAVLTKGYNLPCDYVIHTVGPIVYGELTDALREDLCRCYESVLHCCVENGIRSVAFCCISTGEFHFPNEEAAEIAVKAVTDFLDTHADAMDRVIFNVFKDSDREIYEKLVRAFLADM